MSTMKVCKTPVAENSGLSKERHAQKVHSGVFHFFVCYYL